MTKAFVFGIGGNTNHNDSETTLKKILDIKRSSDYMFHYHRGITDITGYLKYSDTENVTSMNHMFHGCTSLTTVPLFDTSNVTAMEYMFFDCDVLQFVPLFDTSKVTSMAFMFGMGHRLQSIPLFNTKNVDRMDSMFQYCTKLQTVPALDMRKVTSASNMFIDCTNLTDCYIKNIKCTLKVGSDTS